MSTEKHTPELSNALAEIQLQNQMIDGARRAASSLMIKNSALASALSEVLAHVEDESAKRVGNQCTLCKTYRDKIRAALAEGKDAK